jgi:hypothetical protein
MKVEKKESYRASIKRVEADLLRFGISSALTKKLTYSYSLGVLERLIKATEKRQPGEPATYFLNGLKKSTMKHRPQRGPIEAEDIN